MAILPTCFSYLPFHSPLSPRASIPFLYAPPAPIPAAAPPATVPHVPAISLTIPTPAPAVLPPAPAPDSAPAPAPTSPHPPLNLLRDPFQISSATLSPPFKISHQTFFFILDGH